LTASREREKAYFQPGMSRCEPVGALTDLEKLIRETRGKSRYYQAKPGTWMHVYVYSSRFRAGCRVRGHLRDFA